MPCPGCSGDLCQTCTHWARISSVGATDPEVVALQNGRWGVCQHYSVNKWIPRRMYAGNIRELPMAHQRDETSDYEVITTAKGKCPHHAK